VKCKERSTAEKPLPLWARGLDGDGSLDLEQDGDWMSDGDSARLGAEGDAAGGDTGARAAAAVTTGEEDAHALDGEGVKEDAEASVSIAHAELVERLGFEHEPFIAQRPKPLTEAEVQFVAAITAGHAPGTIVRHRNKARIDLSVADILLLRDESWLNDDVLNYVVGMLKFKDDAVASSRSDALISAGRSGDPQRRPRTRTMNSHFFSRL